MLVASRASHRDIGERNGYHIGLDHFEIAIILRTAVTLRADYNYRDLCFLKDAVLPSYGSETKYRRGIS